MKSFEELFAKSRKSPTYWLAQIEFELGERRVKLAKSKRYLHNPQVRSVLLREYRALERYTRKLMNEIK